MDSGDIELRLLRTLLKYLSVYYTLVGSIISGELLLKSLLVLVAIYNISRIFPAWLLPILHSILGYLVDNRPTPAHKDPVWPTKEHH